MRHIFFDIETVPLPEAELLALMPPEIANPVMPQELEEVGQVDLSKCPAYGGDATKQNEWREKTVREAKAKYSKAQEDWRIKSMDAKAKFLVDAALYAERGQVKIMSFREGGTTVCIVIDATKEERAKIEAEKSWPSKVNIPFMSEEEALVYFDMRCREIGKSFKAKLIGYFIASFDLPFLLRRQMIRGVKVSRSLVRSSRYFDEEMYVDICDCWRLGDKQASTGGLSGLAKILGVKEKEGTGEGFYRLWRDDVIAAIKYNLNEMLVIEEVAKRVGATE